MITWRTSRFLIFFLMMQLTVVVIAAVVVFQAELGRISAGALSWFEPDRGPAISERSLPVIDTAGQPVEMGRFPAVRPVAPTRSLFDPAV